MQYHYGQTIKEYRIARKMTQEQLASQWPTKETGVNVRYVIDVEGGKKKITDVETLRKLASILDIPLWQLGLSAYDPFRPDILPGQGEYLMNETLDAIEQLLQQTWYLRQAASITSAEKSAQRVHRLFEHFFHSVPLPSPLEPRFLKLYADAQCVRAVLLVERKRYAEALQTYEGMYKTAQQLGEAGTLAHALMNIGVELERSGQKQEAVDRLEQARDYSFDASKAWGSLVHSYLGRAYASVGEEVRFQRASERAQKLAVYLSAYENDEEAVFYNMSGILAERSGGYLALGKPQMTLAMKDEIMHQIKADTNTRLEAWIYLDWARAYLMLHEVEAGVTEARQFLEQAQRFKLDHAIQRAHEYLQDLEKAGYSEVQAVRVFREELRQTK